MRPDVWLQAVHYLRHALACVRRALLLYLLVTVVYATPALVAGMLAVLVRQPVLWQQVFMIALPWITIVFGTVVIMVAVGYQARDQIVDFGRATGVAIRWVPRYVWTNVHTSIIFWVPVALLLSLRQWLVMAIGAVAAFQFVVDTFSWLAIVSVAVYLHTRTLLAPFLAVHADLPSTLAALEAWRLAGQHFSVCFATLVVGTVPVGLPLAIAALVLVRSLSGAAQEALVVALPDLAWAGIQFVRRY